VEIGNLVLVDLDDICISNTNRQLHTLRSSIGKMKIDEMKERLLDINPECNVTLIHDFVSPENAMDIVQSILPNLTACIDAIDGQTEKTGLFVHMSLILFICVFLVVLLVISKVAKYYGLLHKFYLC